MASNEEQLVVLVEARITDLEKKMAKAQGITTQAYRNMSRSSRTATTAMELDMSRAANRIEYALSATSGTIGRVARAFSYAGPFGGVIAGGLLGATFIQKTIAQQDAVRQVEAVLKSTGGAAGVTSQAAQDLASSLQKVTTYGDETILPAESILLTFTKIGKDIFPKATEVVLDMSQALGQDLKSSAIQVGKALQDPVLGMTALRRVGVNFSADQVKVVAQLVKTRQQAKAQALILKELQKEFGGSARAARDTLGGALKSLGNVLGDTFELHGPEVEGLREKIEDLIMTVSDPKFTHAMADIGDSIFQALSDMAGAVAPLDKAVQDASSDLDTLFEKAKQLGALSGLGNIGKWLTGGKDRDFFAGTPLAGSFVMHYTGDETANGQKIQDRIDEAFGDGEGARTSRVPGATDLGTIAPPPLIRGSTGGTVKLNDLQREIQQFKARTAAIQATTAAQAGLNPLINDYGKAAATAQAKQELLSAAERAGVKITPELTSQIDKVAESYGNATAASNRLVEAQHKSQEQMREWKDTAKGAIDALVSGIENGESAWKAMGDAALSILDKIIDKVENQLVDALFDAKGAGGGIGLGGIFSSLFGGSSFTGSSQLIGALAKGGIGLYASGGIASRPSIFGESGPEAAVPLPDGRRIPVDLRGSIGSGQTGGEIHVYFHNSVDESGNIVPVVTRVSQTIAGKVVQHYDRNVLPVRVNQIKQNPRAIG